MPSTLIVVKGKTFFHSDGSKGGLPTRRGSGPTRYDCAPYDKHGFAEGFVSFRTQCGVQSSLVRYAPNRAIVWAGVRHSGRHRKRLCVSGLRSPELSAQVRRLNSSTSYRQGYGEGISLPPRPKFLSGTLRTAVAVFAHRMFTIWCKACLSRSNAIHSRHTKPLSSPNYRHSRMWELGRRCRWS